MDTTHLVHGHFTKKFIHASKLLQWWEKVNNQHTPPDKNSCHHILTCIMCCVQTGITSSKGLFYVHITLQMDNFCQNITYVIFPRMSVRMLGKKFPCIIHSSLKNKGVDLIIKGESWLCFVFQLYWSKSPYKWIVTVVTDKTKNKKKKKKGWNQKVRWKQDLESHARHLPTTVNQ